MGKIVQNRQQYHIRAFNRSGADIRPTDGGRPAVAPLLAGTGIQLLLVLIGFLDVPLAGLGREIGAYLALLAAVAATVPVARPVVRSWPGRH